MNFQCIPVSFAKNKPPITQIPIHTENENRLTVIQPENIVEHVVLAAGRVGHELERLGELLWVLVVIDL